MNPVKMSPLWNNIWNHLIVCQKMNLGSFKNIIKKM